MVSLFVFKGTLSWRSCFARETNRKQKGASLPPHLPTSPPPHLPPHPVHPMPSPSPLGGEEGGPEGRDGGHADQQPHLPLQRRLASRVDLEDSRLGFAALGAAVFPFALATGKGWNAFLPLVLFVL